jgi:hypothetical protein
MKGKQDHTAPAVRRKDLAVEQGEWERVAQAVLTGLKDWRAQHPRATIAQGAPGD